MPSLARAETRSISIAASPRRVLAVISEPTNLPLRAPVFATTVRPDGEAWLVETDERTARVVFDLSREHGTLDILAVDDARRGAFMRVLPNGEGSELLFTLFFREEATEDAVGRQMAIVEEELRAVKALCEES